MLRLSPLFWRSIDALRLLLRLLPREPANLGSSPFSIGRKSPVRALMHHSL